MKSAAEEVCGEMFVEECFFICNTVWGDWLVDWLGHNNFVSLKGHSMPYFFLDVSHLLRSLYPPGSRKMYLFC